MNKKDSGVHMIRKSKNERKIQLLSDPSKRLDIAVREFKKIFYAYEMTRKSLEKVSSNGFVK